MKNKKAINSIVATALLIVVTVVSTISYQGWLNTYQNSMLTEVEQKSSIESMNTMIDSVIGSNLYFKNGYSNLTINNIKIDGTSCSIIPSNYSKGVIEIDIGNCTKNATSSTPEIVILTNKEVFSKKVYLKNTITTSQTLSLDCSSLVGGEWVLVPGNSTLGTDDFCVMKYEAKDVGGIATSQPSNQPWRNINLTDAKNECESLGIGYYLITNDEWITIARNIEEQDVNWVDAATGAQTSYGIGMLKIGNVGANNGGGYDGSFDPVNRVSDTNTKALLNLSNGEGIWDLSGNVMEWVDNSLPTEGTENSSLGTSSGQHEWKNINGYSYLKPNNDAFDSSNGIGVAFTSTGPTFPLGGNIHYFVRGGNWVGSNTAGVYFLELNVGPSYTGSNLGFRCTYSI